MDELVFAAVYSGGVAGVFRSAVEAQRATTNAYPEIDFVLYRGKLAKGLPTDVVFVVPYTDGAVACITNDEKQAERVAGLLQKVRLAVVEQAKFWRFAVGKLVPIVQKNLDQIAAGAREAKKRLETLGLETADDPSLADLIVDCATPFAPGSADAGSLRPGGAGLPEAKKTRCRCFADSEAGRAIEHDRMVVAFGETEEHIIPRLSNLLPKVPPNSPALEPKNQPEGELTAITTQFEKIYGRAPSPPSSPSSPGPPRS